MPDGSAACRASVRPRDFVELDQNRLCAVLSFPDDDGRFLAVHRYTLRHGRVVEEPPAYATVSSQEVVRVLRPEDRLAWLRAEPDISQVAYRAVRAATRLIDYGVPADCVGVTGSVLVGAEADDSDIDLVCYGRANFSLARRAIAHAIEIGTLTGLDREDWRVAWQRRAPELSLDEYIRHELRKGTKAMVDGTRIDLSHVQAVGEGTVEVGPFRKLSRLQLLAEVTDASAAFDYPARLRIDHPEIPEIVIYTATYFGQAQNGELVEASGWLEEDGLGRRRLLVGTSREAKGEWVKSVRREK